MDFIMFVQKYFVLLLPGIIGILLFHKLNVHKEQHYYLEFIKIITYSIFSFALSDITIGVIKAIFPCFILTPLNVIQFISSDASAIASGNVIVSITYAILLACFLTKSNQKNWLFKIANKLRLTCRTDNQTVWEHAFDTNNVVVLRDYVTKNTYYGCVRTFSDNSEMREMHLMDVRVFNENAELLYHTKELYLSRAHNEFSVEIYDYDSKEKENAINEQ